jgi:hypothetical protein
VRVPLRPPRASDVRAVPALVLAALLVVGLAACGPAGSGDEPDAEATGRGQPADDPAEADPSGDAPAAAPGTPLPEYDVASAVGDLVQGFPAELVPVAPGSQVLASSARSSDDGSLTVITLNLRSEDTVDALTAYYAETLGAAGFTVSPSGVPSALTSLTTFVRAPAADAPAESVAVGIFDDEAERLVTISGQVVGG